MPDGSNLFSLDGRVALVTGGAKGIGATYSEALLGAGARVVVADIDPQAVQQTSHRLSAKHPDCVLGSEVDVTSRPSITAAIQQTNERWGRLDILVNNAAFFSAIPVHDSPWGIPDDEWDRVMAVNTRGIYACAVGVLPLMRQGGWGRIINIASGLAFKGAAGMMHYAASKAAVVNMTRSMASTLGGTGITVNALAPGQTASETLVASRLNYTQEATVQTRIIKRVETPEDLVGTLLYLASTASDFLTGQTIVVDGGSYLH